MRKYTVSILYLPEHQYCMGTLQKGQTLEEVISFLATKKCYLQKIVLLELLGTCGGSCILKYTGNYAAIITEEFETPSTTKTTAAQAPKSE